MPSYEKRPTRHNGSVIRERRIRAGMTAEQLGKKVGLSYKAINNLENENRETRPERLYKIAKVLGLDYDDLLHGNGNGETRQQ